MQTVRGRRARWAGALAAVPLLVSGAATAAMAAPAAGNAQPYALTATATIAQDGSTALTLGVSTNAAAYAVPTTLKHVQLKSFNAIGEQVFTKNLTNVATPGGAVTLNRTDLLAGQRVKVQAQAQTGSTKNTQVLEAEVAVQRRPDLTVSEANAVAQAAPGAPIAIAAVVRELNNDLGATGTVTVSEGATTLDSVAVDVAAGGTTSTGLLVELTEPGTHTLTVSVGGVTPAEWDTTNNSATVVVEVIQPNKTLDYSASYTNVTDRHYQWSSDGSGYDCGYYYGYCGPRSYVEDSQSESFNANYWTAENIAIDGTLDVTFTSESGVEQVFEAQLNWDGYSWYAYDPSSNTQVQVQPNGGGSYVYLWHSAGTWTYSDSYCDYWYGCYTYGGTNQHGTYWDAEESLTVDLDISTTDGSNFGGEISIDLAPYTYSYGYSYWDWYYGYVNYAETQNYFSGSAYGTTSW
jgi:hypothetical protein